MALIANTTVLSNFALVQRPDLLQIASSGELATTTQVMEEIQQGVERGILPPCDWHWLPIRTLDSPEEVRLFEHIHRRLGKGEAACLVVAIHRGLQLLTDDADARRWAQRAGIPVSGTIGVLVALVRHRTLTLDEGNSLLREMIAKGYYSPVDRLEGFL